MDPMAEASLPDIRARSRPGTAIAAMIPMIATTISSSIRVKPLLLRIFIGIQLSLQTCGERNSAGGRTGGVSQEVCNQPAISALSDGRRRTNEFPNDSLVLL